MIWYFPSWTGDFRLERIDDSKCALTIVTPTPHERALLRSFLAAARKKRWTEEEIGEDEVIELRSIPLAASVDKVGQVLVKAVKPADRTLTAVSYRDGRLDVAETGRLTTIIGDASTSGEAKAAVSVARPTLSCPACVPGAIAPASEVLLQFLSPREHEDWAEHRAIIVTGGLSGHRYLLAHRNSDTARRIGRVCYDLDDSLVIHAHDWTTTPEEEILAMKLFLGHREPFIRNEASVLWRRPSDGKWEDLGYMRFKNPIGNAQDGVADAAFTMGLGLVFDIIKRRFI